MIFMGMLNRAMGMLMWRVFHENALGFFGEEYKGEPRASRRGDKEFPFRVSDSQSAALDLLHMAPALTDSGFLNDFHLKPTPVTANRARLHTVTAASA